VSIERPIPDPSGKLLPGVRFFPGLTTAPEHRIELSNGTAETAETSDADSYVTGAIVPREPWREAVRDEYEVIASSSPEPMGTTISLVQFPSELLEPFEVLRRAARECVTVSKVQHLLRNPTCDAGKARLIELLRQHFEMDNRDPIVGGIHVNAPGLPDTTIDPRTRRLVGLHVDRWYDTPLLERGSSPNRICINLGGERRYFIFVNLSLDQMVRAVQESTGPAIPCSGTSLARQFLRLFPHYPAVRLAVYPGEGYVGPTENVAHDGSSAGMCSFDVTLSLRGRFEPNDVR